MNKPSRSHPIQTLAEFWGIHDLTDFEDQEDQLEELEEPIFFRESLVKIHLLPVELEVIKQVAEQQRIDYTDLIREWVLETIYITS